MSFSPVLNFTLIIAVAFTFRDARCIHAVKDRLYDLIVNKIDENLISTCAYIRHLFEDNAFNRGGRKSTTNGANRKVKDMNRLVQ